MDSIDYNRHYRLLHQFTDSYYNTMADSYGPVIARAGMPSKEAKILDVGGGKGFMGHELLRAGYKNVAVIDADPAQVEIARNRGLPVELVDPAQLQPYLAGLRNQVDVIFLMDVLEHLKKEQQIPTLQKLRSTLKSGGHILVQVPNAVWWLGAYNRYLDWTHECCFTFESWSLVLENAGFDLVWFGKGHNKPSPPRNLVISLLMSAVRFGLQSLVSLLWRTFMIAGLGPKGISHPIAANLIAVASPQIDS
jgi:2-polyprenyl-3-methyl-5-hydroxy-6-metoxy-1,4-benzoquinol methylase